MTVRAKFKVTKIGRQAQTINNPHTGKWEEGEVQTLSLQPVYGNGDPTHENTRFWNATPSGSIELAVVHKAAGEYFELGQEYYVDFSKAD